MQVVTREFVKNKKVLLRYDMDVALRLAPLAQGKLSGDKEMEVAEDFKLRAGIPTLKLCLENASKVIIIGHLGRPFQTVDDEKSGNPQGLSAKPIKEWLEKNLGLEIEFAESLEQVIQSTKKLILLENIRFFHGEVPGAEYHTTCLSKTCDIDFAKQLALLGHSPRGGAGVYVNESFSAYNVAASTTMVPKLLPHRAGLHFIKEVETLLSLKNNPKKPFIGIMGGAKVKDKLPVINVLAEKADAILVGGKLVQEIKDQNASLPTNVLVGRLKDDGLDITQETTDSWRDLILRAKMIVWNGPLGKFEDPKNDQSKRAAEIVLESDAEVVVGGGDTVALLGSLNLMEKFQKKGFVSVGGGAMLKLLSDGILPTIDALK